MSNESETRNNNILIDQLVPYGLIPYGTYTSGLSTMLSSWDLRNLILWLASRLYAFSAYPVELSYSAVPLIGTTDTPEVHAPRSSRTRGTPTQVSTLTAD